MTTKLPIYGIDRFGNMWRRMNGKYVKNGVGTNGMPGYLTPTKEPKNKK
jgi:hypothetical protein